MKSKLNSKWNSKAIKYDAKRFFPKGTRMDIVNKTYIIDKTTGQSLEVEDEVKITLPYKLKLENVEQMRLAMVANGHACVWDGSIRNLTVYNREIRLQMINKL